MVNGFSLKKTSGPVYARIPKGSREKSCRLFTKLVNKVVSHNDKEAWEMLLNFARCGLGSSKRGGRKHTSQATLINKRLEVFSSRALNMEQPKEKKEKKKSQDKSDLLLRDQVSAKLAMGDVRGAVNLVSSRESVLPHLRTQNLSYYQNTLREMFIVKSHQSHYLTKITIWTISKSARLM